MFFEISLERTMWRVLEVRSQLVALNRSRSPQLRRWISGAICCRGNSLCFRRSARKAAIRFHNQVRSSSTAEEQLVSALKAPTHDFASVLSYTRHIVDAFSLLFAICCAMKRPFQRWVFHYGGISGCWDIVCWIQGRTVVRLYAKKVRLERVKLP